MLHTFLTFINTMILLFISGLHFYWAFGGKWGIQHTIPEKFKADFFNEKNRTKMNVATLIVAIGLLMLSIITLSNYANLFSFLPHHMIIIFTRIIGGIFLLRGIGDFNMFGLFRKKRNTLFAVKDKQVFTPLCLYLGISSIFISL